jgi:hypothetical protein
MRWAVIIFMAASVDVFAGDLQVAFGRVYKNYTVESIGKDGVVIRYGTGTYPSGEDARQSVKIPTSWLTKSQIRDLNEQLQEIQKIKSEESRLDSAHAYVWIRIAWFTDHGFYAHMSPVVEVDGIERCGDGDELIFIEGKAEPEIEKGSNWTMHLYFLGVVDDSDRRKVFTRYRNRAREVLIDGKSFLRPE